MATWPSGLRRQVKVLVSSEARVRTSRLSLYPLFFFNVGVINVRCSAAIDVKISLIEIQNVIIVSLEENLKPVTNGETIETGFTLQVLYFI